MKQIPLFTFIFFSIFTLVCCTRNAKTDKIEPINQDSALLQELSNVNNELLEEHPQTKLTKRQFLNVASADLSGAWEGGKAGAYLGGKIGVPFGNPLTGASFGAFIGAVAVGSFQSWLAYPENDGSVISSNDFLNMFRDKMAKCELDPDENIFSEKINDCIYAEIEENPYITSKEKEKILIEDKLLDKVELSKPAIVVGQVHNVMLSECFTKKMELKTKSNLGINTSSSLSDPLFNAILMSDGLKELLDGNVSSEETLPSIVLDMFISIYQSYPENDFDVVKIINRYSQVIQESNELTSDEKEWLSYGFSTALYSYNYWSKTYEGK